jgi:hypothetical protein
VIAGTADRSIRFIMRTRLAEVRRPGQGSLRMMTAAIPIAILLLVILWAVPLQVGAAYRRAAAVIGTRPTV